jgi:hypothetical protein
MWIIITDTKYIIKTCIVYDDEWDSAIFKTKNEAQVSTNIWNELPCDVWGKNAKPVPIPLIEFPITVL